VDNFLGENGSKIIQKHKKSTKKVEEMKQVNNEETNINNTVM